MTAVAEFPTLWGRVAVDEKGKLLFRPKPSWSLPPLPGNPTFRTFWGSVSGAIVRLQIERKVLSRRFKFTGLSGRKLRKRRCQICRKWTKRLRLCSTCQVEILRFNLKFRDKKALNSEDDPGFENVIRAYEEDR